jgi:hypothetical protein
MPALGTKGLISKAKTWAPRSKTASVGRICNFSLACTSFALHRIDFMSCQYRLLYRREACSVAGRAGMLFYLRHHDEPFRPAASWRPLSFCLPKKMAPAGCALRPCPDAKVGCKDPLQIIISVRPRCPILLTTLRSQVSHLGSTGRRNTKLFHWPAVRHRRRRHSGQGHHSLTG